MIGQTISNYKILEQIGEGGMGVVYKALDTQLDRHVAIKFLSPHLRTDDISKKRFIHEAKAASALEHPNICSIFGIDETPDGRTFIIMPCYNGQSLDTVISKGPLNLGEAIDISLQIASGLVKASDKGIIHRDIKPENIFITEDQVAKILDFGLAKLVKQENLTKTDRIVGTVSYMSPEQVRGEEVDTRTDVFSLGVVLYQLISGQLPFKGGHEAATIYNILNVEPAKLKTHLLDLPDSLQRIIDKALAKDRNHRYQDASEFLADLERARDELRYSDPLKKHIFGRTKHVGIWNGRIRMLLTAVVAAIAVFLIWMQIQKYRGVVHIQDAALAVLDFTDLATPDDRFLSASVMGLLNVGLVQNSPCRVISPEYLHELRRRLFGTVEDKIQSDQALEVARKSGAKVLLLGQLGTSNNTPYIAWRLVDTENGESLGAGRENGITYAMLADNVIYKVRTLLTSIFELSNLPEPKSVTEFTTNSAEAYQHYILGTIAQREYRIEDAVSELRRAVAFDSTFALAYLKLSMMYYSSMAGGFEKDTALKYANKAWEHRGNLDARHFLQIKARQLELSNQPNEALDVYKEMLSRWPDDLETLCEYADKLYFYDRLNDSKQVLEQGLKLYPDHDYLNFYYGVVLDMTGFSKEALEVSRANVKRSPNNPNEWDNMGLRYLKVGLPDSADAAFSRALAIDPDFYFSQLGLGYSAYCRGELSKAINICENTISRSDLPPRVRIKCLISEFSTFPLSVLYFETGRYKDALNVYELALSESQGEEGAGRIEFYLCKHLMRVGQIDRAQQLVEKHQNNALSVKFQPIRAQILIAKDSLEAAEQIVADIKAASSHIVINIQLAQLLAQLALARNNPQEALDAMRDLENDFMVEMGYPEIELWEMRALAYRMAGQPQKAINCLRELLRLYGGHAIAHHELAQIYEDLDDLTMAKQEYSSFLEAWAQADEDLEPIEHARARLKVLKTGSH